MVKYYDIRNFNYKSETENKRFSYVNNPYLRLRNHKISGNEKISNICIGQLTGITLKNKWPYYKIQISYFLFDTSNVNV